MCDDGNVPSLPNEVIDSIFAFAAPRELHSLIFMSRRFHNLALPHLYAHVYFCIGPGVSNLKHLRPFIYQVLKQPRLASYIKCFSVRGSRGSAYFDKLQSPEQVKQLDQSDPETPRPWPYEDPELENLLFAKAGAAATGEMRKKLAHEALWFSQSAAMTILLANLPNLRVLDTEADLERYELDLLERAGRHEAPFENGSPFDNLEAVMFAGSHDPDPDPSGHLAKLARFPNLKHAYTWNLGGEAHSDEAGRLPFDLTQGVSSLESIEMRHGKINGDDLMAVMQAIKPGALKSFIYEIGNTWCWIDTLTEPITRAVEAHSASLEDICITHTDFYPFNLSGNTDDIIEPMSWRHFSKLKRLRLAPCFVFGHWEVWRNTREEPRTVEQQEEMHANMLTLFPPQLESLHFEHAEQFQAADLFGPINALLKAKQNRVPHLKTMIFEGSFAYRGGRWDAWRSLLEACDAAGVNSRMTRRDYDSDVPQLRLQDMTLKKWGFDEDVEWGFIEKNLYGQVKEDITDRCRRSALEDFRQSEREDP